MAPHFVNSWVSWVLLYTWFPGDKVGIIKSGGQNINLQGCCILSVLCKVTLRIPLGKKINGNTLHKSKSAIINNKTLRHLLATLELTLYKKGINSYLMNVYI